jgi:antirestriction protein ArdC/phage/plasmid primase-like uncharacterized protein
MARKKQVVQDFADEIVRRLEDGTAPWIQPWIPGQLRPMYNPVSGTVYSGINQMMLAARGEVDPRYMTLKQANSKGWRVRRGAQGTPIMYWSMFQKKVVLGEDNQPLFDDDGNKKTKLVSYERPFVRYSYVFHASDVEGIPAYKSQIISQEQRWELDQRAETILSRSGAKIFNDSPNKAFYSPVKDEIHVPLQRQFLASSDYYETLLHELGHWTGHKSRLARDGGPFGSELYAKEELVAEITSWMLGAELGLGHNPENHMNYIGDWITAVKKDPYEIVRACQKAEKAKRMIMAFEKEQELNQEQSQEKGQVQVAQKQPEVIQNPEHVAAKSAPKQSFTRQVAKERVDLLVDYSQRAQAKAAGARWDKDRRTWFAPVGADLSKMQQWLPKAKAPKQEGKVQEKAQEKVQVKGQEKAQGEVFAERTDLAVPYKEKGQAKKFGARWDRKKQTWFAPAGVLKAPLSQWLVNERIAEQVKQRRSVQDVYREFSEALQAAGLDLKGESPIMDGQLHRVSVDGRPKTLDGTYKGFLDGVPAGYIENFVTGYKGNWKSGGYTLTDEEKAQLKVQAARKREAFKLEQEKIQREAATQAYGRWSGAEWAGTEQEYLKRKKVYAFGVKVDEHGNLLVPARNAEGQIQTLQTITPDAKLFVKGGRKKGMYHLIDPDNAIGNEGLPVLIAEGYATAATVHMATGFPTAVAFDASNLEPVAEEILKQFPESQLVFAADDDKHLEQNVGMQKAMAAAQKHKGKVIAPQLNEKEVAAKLSDFNDLHVSRGLEAVKAQILPALRKFMTQDKAQSAGMGVAVGM